jgi:hypothetical protein
MLFGNPCKGCYDTFPKYSADGTPPGNTGTMNLYRGKCVNVVVVNDLRGKARDGH